MVWSLVPALGPSVPSSQTKALNISGLRTAVFRAHVAPEDHPASPQFSAFGLTPIREATFLLLLGLALTESTAIYGFVTALVMIFTMGK